MTEPTDDRAMLERLEGLQRVNFRAVGWRVDDLAMSEDLAAFLPRLLTLARRGLHAQERQDEHARDLEAEGYTIISRDWDSILAENPRGRRERFIGDAGPTEAVLQARVAALEHECSGLSHELSLFQQDPRRTP